MTLDPRLETETTLILNLTLCQVRLHHNAAFPWLILIPKHEGACELIDLAPHDQHLLMEEIARTSHVMKTLFRPHKLNVASLGNVVPRLHIHVVARFQEDPVWPAPIWNSGVFVSYESEKKEALVHRLQEAFAA